MDSSGQHPDLGNARPGPWDAVSCVRDATALQLLDMLSTAVIEIVERLEASLVEAEWDAARRAAHSLRGVARNGHLWDLAALADDVEEILRSVCPERALARAADVERCAGAARELIEKERSRAG
jgi:HPt (histidine-containing phosphotransfer) domain-containing protein